MRLATLLVSLMVFGCEGSLSWKSVDEMVRREIVNLSQYITRFRLEIARINAGDPVTRFRNMADQLDAIMEHTDTATHSILHSLEDITELAVSVPSCPRRTE